MVAALLAVLLLASPSDPPRVTEVKVEGATVWPAARVLAFIRIGPGPLYVPPEEVAQRVESAYRVRGYPAASATAAVQGDVLEIQIDEGRLGRLDLDGVSGDTATWVREIAALPPGTLVSADALRAALSRVEDASDFTVERADWPPYEVRRADGVVVVTLRLQRHGVRLAIAPRIGDSTPTLVNRVDGFAPWLGVDLARADARGRGAWILHLGASYGFTSDDARYSVGVERPVGSRIRLAYAYHDLTDSDDYWRRTTFEPAPTTGVTSTTTEDYLRVKGHVGGIAVDAGRGLSVALSTRIEDHSALPALRDDGLYSGRDNPAATEGHLRSLIAAVRWTGGDSRARLLPRSLFGTPMGGDTQLDASVEIGGGDFDFQRLLVHARGRRAVAPRVALRFRALLGVTGGDVPVQRRLRLGGLGTLRGREFGELEGDDAVLLTAEAAHEPRGAWPGLVAFWDAGAAWTSDVDGAGLRHDLGLGVEWPSGRRALVRVDAAVALDPLPGQEHTVRVTGRLRLPF